MGIYNGNTDNLKEDFELLKPTAICAVPRIFQRIYEDINTQLNKEPEIIKKIFNKALDIKLKDYKETGILKNILFEN